MTAFTAVKGNKINFISIFIECSISHFAWRDTCNSYVLNQCFVCHIGGNYIVLYVQPLEDKKYCVYFKQCFYFLI